jgi:hypothetical protein
VSYILAIEPDPRQAAALKNVARERVGAELTHVETSAAAMASIKQRLPDLILVTTLFSPREEEELIALLRSLDGTEHLQTLTIPLLATDSDDDKPKRGLFRFGKKKKKALPETRGCDPAVFAEQINGYLKTAADLRANAEAQRAFASVHGAPKPAPAEKPIVDREVTSERIIYDRVADEPAMSTPSVSDNSLYQSMFADQPVVEQAAPTSDATAEASVAYDTLYEPILADVKPPTPVSGSAEQETLAEAPPPAPRAPMFSFSAETLGELLERESKLESPARQRRASLTDLPRPSLRSLIDAELSRSAESSPSVDSSESPDSSPSIEPTPSYEAPAAFEPSYAAEPSQEQEQEPISAVEPSPYFEFASSVDEPVATVESTEAVEASALQEIESVFDSLPEPAIELDPEPEPVFEPVILAASPPPPVRLVQRLPPLAMWARIQMPEPARPKAKETSATPVDTHDVLHGLRVPAHVLLISYPQGCRIRKVRSA